MGYTLKLISEHIEQDTDYIIEQDEKSGDKNYKIKGIFMQADIKNRNGRIYPMEVLQKEVKRYNKEYINQKRAFGELGHPDGPTVNLERASHMIVELKQEGTKFVGKSQILSTPCGVIARNLIQDGCSVGFSTRSVGRLEENANGINVVKDMRLIAVDMVADPSCPDAFVNGILESKEYVLADSGDYQEIYSDFERGLKSLPRKDLEAAVSNQIFDFFRKLNGN